MLTKLYPDLYSSKFFRYFSKIVLFANQLRARAQWLTS